jgi:hypothetical protein
MLLLFVASEASGQTSTNTLPFFTLRPFPALPELAERRLVLIPFLSVGERYDNNIFDDPASSPDKADDFITDIGPGVRLRYRPRPEVTLDFDYRTNFEIFANHSSQNQVPQFADLRFNGQLTRLLTLNVSDTFRLTEDQAEQTLNSGPSSNVQQVISNDASIALGIQITPRIVLTPAFTTFLLDQKDFTEVDEFQYSFGAELAYLTHPTRGNRVSVNYRVDFFNFSSNPVPPGGNPADQAQAPDFQVQNATIGYHHAFTPTLSGDVAIGYAIALSDDPAEGNKDAVVAAVGLSKQLRTGAAGLRYTRQFTAGSGEGGRVLSDAFSGFLSTNITPKITAALSAHLALLNYVDTPSNQPSSDRVFWGVSPSLTYQMFRFWSLTVAYDYAFTNYTDPDNADRFDQRFLVVSQFALRNNLFLSLSYRYSSRHFEQSFIVENGQLVDSRDDNPFDRNEVLLQVTFAPPLILQ